MTKAPIMRNAASYSAIAFSLAACGGGGGSDSPSTLVPTPTPPVATPPVVVPPVVPQPVVTPPVTPPIVVPPPAPPAIAACSAPTSPDPVVLFGQTAMTNICGKVYLEPGTPAAEELHLRQSIVAGIDKVTAFYGGTFIGAQADAILCRTAACRTYFMGNFSGAFVPAGSRADAVATYIMARHTIAVTDTSHVNFGRGTIAHEMAHVEMAARIKGGMGVPAWFNEGQASINDEGNLCKNYSQNVVADLRTLDNGFAWNVATNTGATGTPIYCQANREVAAWIANNGKPAYLILLAKVKAGTPFYTAYGTLLTQ